MKRIVIDVTDSQHAQAKKWAAKQHQTVANFFRSLVGWPLEKQGARKDLTENPRKNKKT